MPDNIPKMEAQLKEYLNRYNRAEELFYACDSEDGEKLSPREQNVLNEINCSIETLKKEINRKKKNQQLLIKTSDLQDVINEYGVLVETLNLFIQNDVDATYLTWQEYIKKTGTAYDKAVTSHKTIVANLKMHQDNIANIGGSILSVAGMGLFSWLSTTGKLATLLGKMSEDHANVAEDVAQGIWDKAVSYQAGKLGGKVEITIDTPLVFQNNYFLKALEGYRGIRTEVLKYMGTAIECKSKIVDLQTRKQGDGKEEMQKFIAFENSTFKMINNVTQWTQELPPRISHKELQKDFERSFWADWLPQIRTYSVDISLGLDVDAEHSNWGWTSEFTDKLTDLIDLKKIGIGENGLDKWVSENDARCLVNWAENFKPSVQF